MLVGAQIWLHFGTSSFCYSQSGKYEHPEILKACKVWSLRLTFAGPWVLSVELDPQDATLIFLPGHSVRLCPNTPPPNFKKMPRTPRSRLNLAVCLPTLPCVSLLDTSFFTEKPH